MSCIIVYVHIGCVLYSKTSVQNTMKWISTDGSWGDFRKFNHFNLIRHPVMKPHGARAILHWPNTFVVWNTFFFLFVFLCTVFPLFFPCKHALDRCILPSHFSLTSFEVLSLNYSTSCCSKPVRPSFIFGTQIKIFWMKSERFLTLHRQQHNYHGQRPGR